MIEVRAYDKDSAWKFAAFLVFGSESYLLRESSHVFSSKGEAVATGQRFIAQVLSECAANAMGANLMFHGVFR